MKAITYKKYGNADVLQLTDVAKPKPTANQVLIQLKATSLNASDVELLTAKPAYIRFTGLFKPSKPIIGSDIAGIVEAVGANVTQFEIGDAVFGDVFGKFGGLAEYICADQNVLIKKPDFLSFEQAAAIPQAALVALQGLRKGQVDDDEKNIGKKVLINGAGGGAGSFAIQLAKSFDAVVTAVDSTDKQDFMRKLGADFAIDYNLQNFATNGKKYDLILDLIGSRKAKQVKRALAPNGQYVMVGGNIPTMLSILFGGFFLGIFGQHKIGMLMHHRNQADLEYMLERFKVGEALPIIEQSFSLEQAPAAFKKLINGKARGKLVITI